MPHLSRYRQAEKEQRDLQLFQNAIGAYGDQQYRNRILKLKEQEAAAETQGSEDLAKARAIMEGGVPVAPTAPEAPSGPAWAQNPNIASSGKLQRGAQQPPPIPPSGPQAAPPAGPQAALAAFDANLQEAIKVINDPKERAAFTVQKMRERAILEAQADRRAAAEKLKGAREDGIIEDDDELADLSRDAQNNPKGVIKDIENRRTKAAIKQRAVKSWEDIKPTLDALLPLFKNEKIRAKHEIAYAQAMNDTDHMTKFPAARFLDQVLKDYVREITLDEQQQSGGGSMFDKAMYWQSLALASGLNKLVGGGEQGGTQTAQAPSVAQGQKGPEDQVRDIMASGMSAAEKQKKLQALAKKWGFTAQEMRALAGR